MSRSAVATLSTANLLHNVAAIKKMIGPAKIIAMVKANAYGHGIRSVGQRLDGHVDLLGVASIDEALALRQAGIKCPIILMQGIFEPSELEVAAREKFHVVFNHATHLNWLGQVSLKEPLTCWIKVNTGMGRLGFDPGEARGVYQHLLQHPKTHKPIRVISHFASADEATHPLNSQQIDCFNDLIQDMETEFSFCNSAAILHFPNCHFDYVRPGILLYGISPISGHTAEEWGLKPVMTVKSSLISVQHLKKGSGVGYGARYTCPTDMPVGIVAFGYGDGYPFSARDGAPILVNGFECPLIGRVSMDMLAVDLRFCPGANVGDTVVLWGDGLPLEKVATHTTDIVWNIVTGVQNRVKFRWI